MELKIAKKPIIKWQVGWDDENIPAFGLEFFDSETEAQKYAESLDSEGETGIVLMIFPALLLLWLVIHLAVTDQRGMLMGVYLGCLGVMVFIFASMMG